MSSYSFINHYTYWNKSHLLYSIDRTLTPIRVLCNGKEVSVFKNHESSSSYSLALKVMSLAIAIITAPLMICCLVIKFFSNEKRLIELQRSVMKDRELEFARAIRNEEFTRASSHSTCIHFIDQNNALPLLNILKEHMSEITWGATRIFSVFNESQALELVDLFFQQKFLNTVTPQHVDYPDLNNPQSKQLNMCIFYIDTFIKETLSKHGTKAQSQALKKILAHPKFNDPEYINLIPLRTAISERITILDKSVPLVVDETFKEVARTIPKALLIYGIAALAFSMITRI